MSCTIFHKHTTHAFSHQHTQHTRISSSVPDLHFPLQRLECSKGKCMAGLQNHSHNVTTQTYTHNTQTHTQIYIHTQHANTHANIHTRISSSMPDLHFPLQRLECSKGQCMAGLQNHSHNVTTQTYTHNMQTHTQMYIHTQHANAHANIHTHTTRKNTRKYTHTYFQQRA